MSYEKFINRKKAVPHKLPEEKNLFCDYKYWLSYNGIVLAEILAKFKSDSLRMKKANPIYKD